MSAPAIGSLVRALACFMVLAAFPAPVVSSRAPAPAEGPPSTALVNGLWFDGDSFEPRTVYSVEGRFTFTRPPRVDRTLDLAGFWVVPPFGEAHNHNIDGAVEERSRRAIARYLADGVFYVKIQGNYPLPEEMRSRLPINRPEGPDVALAQTFLTATGGHPIQLQEEILFPQGYYPGLSREALRNRLYFTIDSEAELEAKWPLVLRLRPDFVKTNLWCSDEFEKRRDDPAYIGRKGLDPRLLAKIVAKAHAGGLRVSTHVTNAADFHNAVTAGVDEIVHLPLRGPFPGDAHATAVSAEDARLAAERGVTVVTTAALVLRSAEAARAELRPIQVASLKILQENGVALAIGSDDVADTSVREFEYLRGLGVFDNLALLRMWSHSTPRAIFPHRRIGALEEGYEASFLALGGNPLDDLKHVRDIRLRFKQGVLLER